MNENALRRADIPADDFPAPCELVGSSRVQQGKFQPNKLENEKSDKIYQPLALA
jgi:hypothetical protein